jgi:hypothetical protein
MGNVYTNDEHAQRAEIDQIMILGHLVSVMSKTYRDVDGYS